jgi:hypothetical protein
MPASGRDAKVDNLARFDTRRVYLHEAEGNKKGRRSCHEISDIAEMDVNFSIFLLPSCLRPIAWLKKKQSTWLLPQQQQPAGPGTTSSSLPHSRLALHASDICDGSGGKGRRIYALAFVSGMCQVFLVRDGANLERREGYVFGKLAGGALTMK